MAIKFFKKRNKGKAAAEDEVIAIDKAATNDEEYYHAGLIVTTIAVSPKDAADGSKVTFNEKDGNGDDAVFLKEIKMISDGVFEATKVSVEEAKEIANNGFGAKTSTPLFIVHGFDVEPSSSLGYNYGNFKGDKKYYPVPVVWASEGNKALYFEDQNENALGAGRALNALVNFIPNETFPRKSLLMHSMGNHAVFNGACANGTPDVQFENIFMVAADVPHDIFHKDPNESYTFRKNVSGNKNVKATNFFGMLAKTSDNKPMGKVYILWNDSDVALLASFWMNQETRIGKVGVGWVDGWFRNSYDDKVIRDEFRGYIENFNVSEQKMEKDEDINHSYQLDSWAIDYYEKKANLIQLE